VNEPPPEFLLLGIFVPWSLAVSRLLQLPLEIPGNSKIEKDGDQDPQQKEKVGKPGKSQSNVNIPGKVGPGQIR
jgi:hypothetical protein